MSRKQSMKLNIDKQTGRSMVEMLGVIAIIGVLTIGGIVGYQYGLQIYRENRTIKAFSTTVAGARTAELMSNFYQECFEKGEMHGCKVDPKFVVSGVGDLRMEDFSTALGVPMMVQIENEEGYTVRIQGLSRDMCETFKQGEWAETCAGVLTNATELLRYGCAYGSMGKLADVDCNKFPMATTGLLRRSAMQEAIEQSDSGLPVFGSMQYPAFVLYYKEKADVDFNVINMSPSYSPPLSEDPDSYCQEGSPLDSKGNVSRLCCVEAGGIWRNSLCCVNSGEFIGSEFTNQSIVKNPDCWCAMRNGVRSVYSIRTQKRPDPTCCHYAGFTWKNGECCNGKVTWDLQPSPNCYKEVNEFCPAPNIIQGAVCCEVVSGKITGKDFTTKLATKECNIYQPDLVCSSFYCEGVGTAVEKDGTCCCGKINAHTGLEDTKCYTPLITTCEDKQGVCKTRYSECDVCCEQGLTGWTVDHTEDKLCEASCEPQGRCAGYNCSICCELVDGKKTGKTVSGTSEPLCVSSCEEEGGTCVKPAANGGCEICCELKEGEKTGNILGGETNTLCEKTCEEEGGTCVKPAANGGCEICCELKEGEKTGNILGGGTNTLCEKTCEDFGHLCVADNAGNSCATCCELVDGIMTGKEFLTSSDSAACYPNCVKDLGGVCPEGAEMCSLCCEVDDQGRRTGYQLWPNRGDLAETCKPACDQLGGVSVSAANNHVCCEVDNEGIKTGFQINMNDPDNTDTEKHTLCTPTCEEQKGKCVSGTDSDCAICCELDGDKKTGYILGTTQEVSECAFNEEEYCHEHSGTCVNPDCTICCEVDANEQWTGTAILGENTLCDPRPYEDCEDDEIGGECHGAGCEACCDPKNLGKNMDGAVISICCEGNGGKCIDSDCSICCDKANQGKILGTGVYNEKCVDMFCPTVNPIDENYTCVATETACCNPEALIAALSGTQNAIQKATLCGTDNQHSGCCAIYYGGDYDVKRNF